MGDELGSSGGLQGLPYGDHGGQKDNNGEIDALIGFSRREDPGENHDHGAADHRDRRGQQVEGGQSEGRRKDAGCQNNPIGFAEAKPPLGQGQAPQLRQGRFQPFLVSLNQQDIPCCKTDPADPLP